MKMGTLRISHTSSSHSLIGERANNASLQGRKASPSKIEISPWGARHLTTNFVSSRLTALGSPRMQGKLIPSIKFGDLAS